MKDAKEKFKKFLCEFREETEDTLDDDEEMPYYLRRLEEVCIGECIPVCHYICCYLCWLDQYTGGAISVRGLFPCEAF